MNSLTKKEIEILRKIAENRRGAGKIESFIWLNTTEAKFKAGDKVYFTDRRREIYGNTPIDWVGTIIKVNYRSNDKSIHYEIKCEVLNGDIKYTSNHYLTEIEGNLKKTEKPSTVNIIKGTNDTEDCIHIPLNNFFKGKGM